ncbi:chlorohydrolase [Streptococcus pneumoniae]|uniref:Chlorohydrolase n=2 Tax=Streptococcus pneumoniae TaxID=1313 RepID=A0AA87C7M7_STREE|nr:chlorohydrolase [Streptococcus pneumoniae]
MKIKEQTRKEVVDETDEVSSKHVYSMKIKEQTRKLAAGCSKQCFEVVDRTDEVSSKHGFEVVDETDEVSNHTYGKATLTRIEEIFEEYKSS